MNQRLSSIRLCLLMVALALVFAACSTAGADDFDASKIECPNVAAQLKDANAALTTATNAAEKADGTPNADSAADKVAAAQQKVAALDARSSECASTQKTTLDGKELTQEQAHQIGTEVTNIYAGGPEGFRAGEVNVGSDAIPASAEERSATHSFTKETIETREDLCAFFKSDNSLAAGARNRVEQSLRTAGYDDNEVNTALNTDCGRWIWVAPTVESQVMGTTYAVNGDIQKADNWRQTAPNDAIWFYVTNDAHIVKGASVRADCGNPEVEKVRPVRPHTPPAPPIECAMDCKPPPKCRMCTTTTTRPPCQHNCSTTTSTPCTVCPKDPTQNIDRNPGVPAGSTKTGPSTDNQSEISRGPTQPYDTPTGCNGPCPTTAPTQSGGSSGNQGQGSTDNGTSTPPATSAPHSPTPPTSEPPPDSGVPQH